MKLKNCKVGQKVVLKKNITKNDLYDGGSGYDSWCWQAGNVADELLAGGSVLIQGIRGDVVDLVHESNSLCLLPKFLKLAEKEHPKEEITAEGEIVKTVESQQCEIKPFMLVEVLDAHLSDGLCEVGEQLVVKCVDSGGYLVCICSESKYKENGAKTVYLNPIRVKVINSNIGEDA